MFLAQLCRRRTVKSTQTPLSGEVPLFSGQLRLNHRVGVRVKHVIWEVLIVRVAL